MRTLLVALSAIVAGAACGSSSFEGNSQTAQSAPGENGSSSSSSGTGATEVNGDGSSNGGGSTSSSGTAGDSGPPPPRVVQTKESITVWEHARSFVLVAPKSPVAGKSYPVVFAFHGDGGDGSGMHALLPYESVGGESAIYVFPDGKDASWDLYTPQASNEDDAFVEAMMTVLKGRYSVDETRIFGTGYSSGAFFINQLACRRSTFFRAIAPNAGGAPQEPQDPAASTWSGSYVKCANQTGGVAALVMHGDADYVVGTGSGNYDAKYWATVNGCNATEDARVPTTPAPCVEHASCPTGKRVVYCEIAGLGHVVWDQALKTSWAFFASQ